MKLNSYILLIVGFTLANTYAFCQQSNSVVQFRGGPDRSGVFDGEDFNTIKGFRWQFGTGGAVRSSPVYADGKVYAGSSDGKLYCLDGGSGKLLWSFPTGQAVHSSPLVSQGKLYFTNKKNILFALEAGSGRLLWKTDLHADLEYPWGFDYYQSSPTIYGGTLFVGSGNGSLYALNASDGKVVWEFKARSLVRSSPTVYNQAVYFGDLSGKIYCVDTKTGKARWNFTVVGDTINNEAEGNDYKAVIASVAVSDNIAVVGARDGFLYGLDAQTGMELWKHSFDFSWVITSVAIQGNTVITGTSDERVLLSLDLHSGKPKWSYKVPSSVWASPIVVGSTVLGVVNDGFIYCVDLVTGQEKDRFRLGIRALSSPSFHQGLIYIGNDDGRISALETAQEVRSERTVKKAVFFASDVMGKYFKPGPNNLVRDYFLAEGYDLLDEGTLVQFLKQNGSPDISSVVVFATGYFPEKIVAGGYHESLLYDYLAHGGKVVVTGTNPALHKFNFSKQTYLGLSYAQCDTLIGVSYRHNDLRSHYGFYSSKPTAAGDRWGLKHTITTWGGVDASQVSPLALDENGRATYWVKNYGHREGTGFVQLWIDATSLDDLVEVNQIASYGID